MIDSKISKAAPGQILGNDFIDRLRIVIRNVGQAAVTNPFVSAAGWTLAGLVAAFALLVAIGRVDMLPDIVTKLVRFVGGS